MMNKITQGLLATAIGIGLLAGSSHAAVAIPSGYSSLVVFGDSLSDSGNNSLVFGNDPAQVISGNGYIPGQPYASGTYSNGPVWATPFAANLGLSLTPSLLGGSNYAYGGSVTNPDGVYLGGLVTLPSLVSQAGQYLGTGPADAASTLFVVAGGGNNARAVLNASASVIGAGGDPSALIATQANQFATDIGDIVDALQGAGAQHIIVWNTPNIGLVPAVLENGAQASFLGSSIASSMNNALAARLDGESGVQTFDLFGLLSRAAGSGAFTNLSDACGNPALACSNDLNTAMFYDGIHPTTAAHAFIAGEMQVLAAVPEPETWALMLAGIGLVGAHVRRRRRHH
jgi:outer membrane lipase/esterase